MNCIIIIIIIIIINSRTLDYTAFRVKIWLYLWNICTRFYVNILNLMVHCTDHNVTYMITMLWQPRISDYEGA